MCVKELNTPMNHEQLKTPRELTSEELEMVVGGAGTIGSGTLGAGAGKAVFNPEDGNNQDGNSQGYTTSIGREQSAPSVSEIVKTSM
jgi:lactobin A/cerein 7B family class IIb bacteriocin